MQLPDPVYGSPDGSLDGSLDGSSPGSPGSDTGADELTIHVDGTEQSFATTADLDDDGRAESVYVGATEASTEGGYAYTDTSGDGVADTLTEFDARGGVVTQAVYDPATGGWNEVAPGSVTAIGAGPTSLEPAGLAPTGVAPTGGTGSGHIITVDTPDGPTPAGAATYDTDGDGKADTTVASTVDGTTLVVTDVDGDGAADVVTEVSSDGTYSSFEHTGAGEWTAVDGGNLADGVGGGNLADGVGGGQPVSAPVTTDPATGQWTST